ncbi:Vacuolar protein sorting-associated protein 13D [Clonorchis sinensis]|uniref:Vacuolar protein sorting-associated protein 13D n=1 Tax=Clonorchis sinensis TaxID=79923 RepID=A0A8T1N048_CLOSI|nr:Vacuolar protein sorting-associated protein 13D [Clonorchis sinensis]
MVTRLTVDRFSVLVIRVIQPTPTTDEAICHGNVCRAERIVLTTLDKIDICSESDLCSRKMSFRLNGLRVLDLTQNSLRYRYLLTAGIVSKSVGTSSASVTDRSNSAVFLNLRWPTSDADHTELSLFLPHFTYVHSASTIEQLISWTQTLPTWRIDAKVFPPPASSEMSRYLFSVSGCCEIVQPVLVIPDGTASSSRALIVRLQNVHLLNPDCPSLCPNRLTTCTGNRMCTRFDSAEMLFVEFAKFPALHISSPVLAERMLRFYRSVTCPSSSRQSSGAEQILAPISGCLWLSSPISGFHLPRWYSSFTVRPSDLFSDSPPESVDPSFSSNQPSSSANSLELFLLEVKVERAVRIYLTKPVCLHLSRFLLSVSSLRTQFGGTCGSLEPPSSDSPKSRISLCLSLPHLQLDTMADLDIYPVPLACLKLNDLVVKLAQASNTTPHLSSCGELFARDLVLCDVLPVENGSTPNVDPILFSVLPENAESAALSKTTSNITASCPDLTSNWDRGSKIHTASVGSCSHAISDDQLATCQACSAYDTFAHSLQLFHTAALRIQLLMLSNLIDSGVPEKFSQAKRMIRVQCKQVFSRLRPQPWVLLLDFLSFSSPDGSSFDTRLQSSLNLSEQILPTNAGTTASTISKPTLISISADAFEVVLTTTSCDDPTPCDLAKFSGHTARLCLVDLVDQLEPYLPVDRQFTPDNFPGPYLFMEGGLGDLVIRTNSANDCSPYNERFRIRSPAEPPQAPSVDSTLLFRLLRSVTPSPGNLEINGYFWARIAPSMYVHIQPFMVAVLESIMELFDLRDMFSRARRSAEGQMINTQAPTSPMFLLDIVLSDPRFVVPVGSCSPEALVVVMDRLMVKTSCLCTHDEVDFVSPIDESRRYRPHCFQRLPVSDPLFQCRCCSASSISQESSLETDFFWTRKIALPAIHTLVSEISVSHSTSLPIVRGCGEDGGTPVKAGIRSSLVSLHLPVGRAHCLLRKASSPIVPSDTLVQCLHFSDYLVTPGQQPNRLRHTLFDSKSMQFRLERNLHSARSHHVPDWRLVTPLTDVQIYLNEHIYSVVRGILSHNFGDAGARKDKTEPSAATSLLDRFKLPQLCDLRHPSYYPPKAGLQTAITGIPWTVFSFEIPMENVRFLCFDDANGSSGSGEHSRIDFRLACFSFDALSDRRVFVELRCAKVRFIDPQINKAIIAPLDPLLHDGLQSRGSRPNLMTSPVVHCFWLQYIMDQGSAALWLHLDRMRILYHYNAFSRLLSFLKSPPSSKCSVDPPQSGSSQSSFAYQLCAENSELELVGPRDCAKSSAILLQGTVLLAYSDLNGVWKTTVPCAHLCLHTVRLRLTCDRRARGKCIVDLQSARLDLSPDQAVHSTSQQSLPSVRRQCSQPMSSLSNSVAAGRLWRGWTNWQHMDSTPPPRPPKLNMVCTTSTISVRVSPHIIRKLRSIARVIRRQMFEDDASHDDQIELFMPLEGNENTRRRPFTVATWIQRLDSLADWISPFVHDIKIQTGFSFRILRAELGYLVPLFDALLPRLTLTWCREETSPIGVLKADGLALNYFNRDLVAWEPALEPWSCSLEWYQMLTDSFTKTSTVIFTSSETLNLNLTVPLCLLVRRLLETTQQDSTGCDATPVSSTTSPASNETTGSDGPTNAAPFRLLNRTGCNVSFKVLPMNQIDGVFQNEGSLEELESRPWYHVGSAQEIVDIPSLTTQSEKSQDSSVLLLTNPPSLLFRVAGWKPTYPISVDRLGIYFRTLERNDFEEDIDEDKVFTLTDYLPQFTRLVIEVVRTGPSVQHVIVLRSGLTITNDLADGHQLLVGLQPPTAPLQSVPEDIWSSQLDDANLPIQRIPVCLIDSGDTAAVPLNLAAVLSRGFGVLSFCPTLIPIGPGRNMSSVFSQMVGPSFAAYGWAGVSLPGATPATQSETATGVVTSSSLLELSEIEAAKHLDWTNLKQPGELIETILVCRSSTATNQVGLLSATLDSAATSVSSSSTSAPISYHRTQSIPRQYNMCLAMVRDSFPPDPLWTGLLSTSNRANPKCLPGHHITVGPIVRITNLLPCDLVYYFSGTMVKGSISAGADACVNELSPAEVLRFGVHLDGFPKCEPLTIPPNTYDQKVLLRLQDTLGRPLELQGNPYGLVQVGEQEFKVLFDTGGWTSWLVSSRSTAAYHENKIKYSDQSETRASLNQDYRVEYGDVVHEGNLVTDNLLIGGHCVEQFQFVEMHTSSAVVVPGQEYDGVFATKKLHGEDAESEQSTVCLLDSILNTGGVATPVFTFRFCGSPGVLGDSWFEHGDLVFGEVRAAYHQLPVYFLPVYTSQQWKVYVDRQVDQSRFGRILSGVKFWRV